MGSLGLVTRSTRRMTVDTLFASRLGPPPLDESEPTRASIMLGIFSPAECALHRLDGSLRTRTEPNPTWQQAEKMPRVVGRWASQVGLVATVSPELFSNCQQNPGTRGQI